MTDLPISVCRFGYPRDQVRAVVGDAQVDAFGKWMRGQTGAICDGQQYNYDLKVYESTGCGPHGMVVYKWDVERFLRGLSALD